MSCLPRLPTSDTDGEAGRTGGPVESGFVNFAGELLIFTDSPDPSYAVLRLPYVGRLLHGGLFLQYCEAADKLTQQTSPARRRESLLRLLSRPSITQFSAISAPLPEDTPVNDFLDGDSQDDVSWAGTLDLVSQVV